MCGLYLTLLECVNSFLRDHINLHWQFYLYNPHYATGPIHLEMCLFAESLQDLWIPYSPLKSNLMCLIFHLHYIGKKNVMCTEKWIWTLINTASLPDSSCLSYPSLSVHLYTQVHPPEIQGWGKSWTPAFYLGFSKALLNAGCVSSTFC